MPDAITTAFVKQFSGNVEYIVQQKGARLRRTVREESVTGEEAYFDQVGPAPDPVKIVGRHQDTPLHDMPQARRKLVTYPYVYATLLDKQDKIRTLIDPQSVYAQNAAWTMGRAIDDAIIAAANGTAYTGKAGATGVALPTAQKVVWASGGMTLAKLLAAKEILDAAECDPDEPRYCVLTASQVTDLLNTAEVKDYDYNTVKALAAGQLNTFCGFEFIRTERLTVDASSHTLVLCWVKSGLLLGLGEDVKADIGPRRDKNNSIQVLYGMDIGATRMEEKKVVQIACTA
jgi:hypothetical protein